MNGHLAPGQRIVEGYWARRFGVAQTAVREAINRLIAEGLVTKASGRSARVTSYSDADIAQIYELRGALERLAARRAAGRKPDLRPLEATLKEMRATTKKGDIRKLIEADLKFHVCLCELCGNRFLYSQIRTLLVPLFAFVSMRVIQSHQTAQAWASDWNVINAWSNSSVKEIPMQQNSLSVRLCNSLERAPLPSGREGKTRIRRINASEPRWRPPYREIGLAKPPARQPNPKNRLFARHRFRDAGRSFHGAARNPGGSQNSLPGQHHLPKTVQLPPHCRFLWCVDRGPRSAGGLNAQGACEGGPVLPGPCPGGGTIFS
jgi:DNA-binding GntR family transcriptional regulator